MLVFKFSGIQTIFFNYMVLDMMIFYIDHTLRGMVLSLSLHLFYHNRIYYTTKSKSIPYSSYA